VQSAATTITLPEELFAAPVLETPPYINARGVSRRFGSLQALRDVSLSVAPGEIHAVLGRNGAGKTTLVRILCGLTTPHEGTVTVLGEDVTRGSRSLRGNVGLVPSGDRSFYLRLSGFENLLFFARLHGMRNRLARERALVALEAVDLANEMRKPVGRYSHGMQKRLSVARALLTEPPLLIVDEATHDLDPYAARVVRELVRERARCGTATFWATQRVEEIRGFAHRVTLLREGEVAFAGSVSAFADEVPVRSHLLRLGGNGAGTRPSREALQRALTTMGEIVPSGMRDDEYVVRLAGSAVLGDALTALAGVGARVISCRDERSEIEEAFIHLTGRA
jgi:ABC-2 type transport system ATP-binding protein